jgi:hypothetical protein
MYALFTIICHDAGSGFIQGFTGKNLVEYDRMEKPPFFIKFSNEFLL